MKATLLSSIFIASALAAPTINWTPALGEFYSAVDAHIREARQNGANGAVYPQSCDLSKAQLPSAPTALPAPDPSWYLSSVVVGRGVQNYTCSSASPNIKPVALGAVATLYNVSCLASNYPNILEMLPGLALQYPLPPDGGANLQPSNLLLEGHHYFDAAGVPTFELNSGPNKLGVGKFKKTANSTAPATAIKGEMGLGNGAVAWLLLSATTGTDGNLAGVYRVNTAGGNPPDNCQSSPAVFSVQYATEYWFYSKKP